MDSKDRTMDSRSVTQGPIDQGAARAGYAARPAVRKRGASPAVWLLAGLLMLALFATAAAAFWFVGVGSVFDRLASVKVGELRVESKSVPQGSAASVAVNVNIGEGMLTLTGGATGLLDADFSYNVDTWKPQVAYKETGAQGALSIEQARTEGFIRTPDGVRNDWNLRLKDGLPLTLTASMGAGTSTIKLDGLSVSKLDMSTGAGAVSLDLTGNWKQSLNATLQAGVGDTTIMLPKNVGVRIKVESGVSNVDSGGLNRNGNDYTNAAYGSSPVTIDITIKSGVGDVKIQP